MTIKRLVLAPLLTFSVLIFWVGETFTASAQSKVASGTVVAPDDRSPVRVRYPAPDRLRKLQTDRDYQYGHDAPPPENPLGRFWAWLWQKIGEFLGSKAYENVWQYVVLAAIAGVVIYLLLKAEVLGFLFPKRAQSGQLNYENLTEDIHAIDFGTAIDEAVGQRNYRLAVRLRYLQTLKMLADLNIIHWQVNKTNWQYVNELKGSSLESEFTNLTKRFEQIWYGSFPIDENTYKECLAEYESMGYALDHNPAFGR